MISILLSTIASDSGNDENFNFLSFNIELAILESLLATIMLFSPNGTEDIFLDGEESQPSLQAILLCS